MKVRRSIAILLMFMMLLVPQYSALAVFAGDSAESIEFEVSVDAYNETYKDDPRYELIGTVDYYRYRTRTMSYTTSGYDTLSGWERYDSSSSTTTSDYKFGTPPSSSTSYANNRKTVTSSVNTGYYYYAYTCANPSNTSDWAYYAATSRDNVISYMKSKFNSSAYAESRLRYYWNIYSEDQGDKTANVGSNIPHVEDSTVSKGTTINDGNAFYGIKLYKYSQCYKTKTVITTNYFRQWSSWSSWGDWTKTRDTAGNTSTRQMEEESETRYVVRRVIEAIPMTDCTAEIVGASEFTYDGDLKQVEVAVYYNDEQLVIGEDYYVEGNTGTDAGTYTARVIGLDAFAGELTCDFVIAKAKPALDFDDETVYLGIGSSDYTNPLHALTDGEISYSSSNEKVAVVGNDGIVSAVSKGNARITVSSTEGANYLAGEAGYDITVSNNLYGCTVIFNGPKSFAYDGKDKSLDFSIYDGDELLTLGTDYTVEGNIARDAGTYDVIIRGTGEYAGELKEVLTISRISPVLEFASLAVAKRTGDAAFTNILSSNTDGEITYTSSNESIAQVDGDGVVTIKGPGNATITAVSGQGTNYKAGRASYSLIVADAENLADINDLSYYFVNTWSSFKYPSGYKIPASSYRMIFGKVVGNYMYALRKNNTWGGNCAGLSATSALIYDSTNDIHVKSFNPAVSAISQLEVTDQTSEEMILRDFIEGMQVAQYASIFQSTDKNYQVTSTELANGRKTLNTLFTTVQEQTNVGSPVLMTLRKTNVGGHAVLAYNTEVSQNQKTAKIYIYDSNHPLEERVITLTGSGNGKWTGWSYDMGGYGVWGSSASSTIGMVPYGVLDSIWKGRGEIQKNYNIMSTNASSVAIYDVEDNLIAKIEDGELVESDGSIVTYSSDLSINEDEEEKTIVSMPIDVYKIKNNDEATDSFELEMVNSNVGASVETSAGEVTMVAADDYALNQVSIDAGEDDYYSVTLNSSLEGDSEEVTVSGMGMGSEGAASVSQSMGQVVVENGQILDMTIDDEEVSKHTITAKSYGSGSIDPAGASQVVDKSDRIYKFKPDNGYEVSDVFVDGESIGALDSYTFKNVTADHEIVVFFEANVNAEKIPNTINAGDITKTVSAVSQSFNIGATSDGIAKLLYSSNNSKVSVSETGVVTIPARFIGCAVITITSPGTDTLLQTTKKITITVTPGKVASFKVKAQKGRKAKASWKKSAGVNGYQIQYSTSKKFKNGKMVSIKSFKTVSKVVKSLKAGKTYYFRIRSYKTDSTGKIWSPWSKTAKIKVRK